MTKKWDLEHRDFHRVYQREYQRKIYKMTPTLKMKKQKYYAYKKISVIFRNILLEN
jgi:hypothetical protein